MEKKPLVIGLIIGLVAMLIIELLLSIFLPQFLSISMYDNIEDFCFDNTYDPDDYWRCIDNFLADYDIEMELTTRYNP